MGILILLALSIKVSSTETKLNELKSSAKESIQTLCGELEHPTCKIIKESFDFYEKCPDKPLQLKGLIVLRKTAEAVTSFFKSLDSTSSFAADHKKYKNLWFSFLEDSQWRDAREDLKNFLKTAEGQIFYEENSGEDSPINRNPNGEVDWEKI